MQRQTGHRLFSATDLVAFLDCEHLTALDYSELASLRCASNVSYELIARKGDQHEPAYSARLGHQGCQVIDIAESRGRIRDLVQRTWAAMLSGAEGLCHHPDFLRRIAGEPTALGDWWGRASFAKAT